LKTDFEQAGSEMALPFYLTQGKESKMKSISEGRAKIID